MSVVATGRSANSCCQVVVTNCVMLCCVQVDYHPHLSELQYLSDPDTFAKKWWMLWTAITCLPNYQTDLKGRILLDLVRHIFDLW